MGIGLATDGKGNVFVVAQYRPAGNITNAGYYEQNVLPPQEGGGSGSDNKPPTPTTKDTPSPTGPTALSVTTADFQKEALEAHNARRQQHGAPPLSLDLDLCRETQKWAEHLVQQNALQHSDTDLGENIYYKWTSDKAAVSGKDAVESWYSEIKDYDFSKSGHQKKTGHFTQVVWKDSQEMGIGMATDGKGKVFVVAQYRPAGNITNAGYYERNVLPPQSDSPHIISQSGQPGPCISPPIHCPHTQL
nr:Golgi-associated plant pathogenesis-related protein 1-like [Paramormyrops kingsleyae]